MPAQDKTSTMRVDAGSDRTWGRILEPRDCRYWISGETISPLKVADPTAPLDQCSVRPLTRNLCHGGSHEDHE